MIIIRLLFFVSAFFILLVAGLFALLLTKGRMNNIKNWQEHMAARKLDANADEVIEGDYKVLDEHNKD